MASIIPSQPSHISILFAVVHNKVRTIYYDVKNMLLLNISSDYYSNPDAKYYDKDIMKPNTVM